MSKEPLYFRPRNWSKFQSRSNNSMAWVKNYTALLHDHIYLSLTPVQRYVLHGIWMLCGSVGRPLARDCSFIGRALAMHCPTVGKALDTLEANNFIELCDPTQKLHDELPHLEKIREEDIEREDKKPPLSPLQGSSGFNEWFESWWKGYPRKIGKGVCKQKTKALLKARTVSRETLDLGLAAYNAKLEAEGTETQYIAHPITWLNQGRWDDDHTVRRKPTQSEQLRAWANGDERNDGGSDSIDGECMELPGGEPDPDSGGLPIGLEGVIGRPSEGSGNGALERVDQISAPEAGGYPDSRKGTQAALERLASVAAKKAKP